MFRNSTRLATMMGSNVASAPFSRAVFRAMRRLYPEDLADKSWDNTGLLLEAPFEPTRRQKNSVLLTVDLTKAVADEAIERKDSVVISYHPIIFRGLKSLTLEDTQQQSLLRLASQGISVYSPHTALDSAPDGINDWLADIITGEPTTIPTSQPSSAPTGSKRPTYLLTHHPSQASIQDKDLKLATIDHDREVIKPIDVSTHPGAGQGRIVRFKKPQALTAILDRVSRGMSNPKGFPVAIPQGASIDDIQVLSVGICAGSGGSLLAPLKNIDLLFTGEMSHHEALAAIERGQSVITLFHSNSERGFLHAVLQAQLQKAVQEEWEQLRAERRDDDDDDEEVVVDVSQRDRDPYGIVIST